MLISFYIEMMLIRIENQYCYGLKILKKKHNVFTANAPVQAVVIADRIWKKDKGNLVTIAIYLS